MITKSRAVVRKILQQLYSWGGILSALDQNFDGRVAGVNRHANKRVAEMDLGRSSTAPSDGRDAAGGMAMALIAEC